MKLFYNDSYTEALEITINKLYIYKDAVVTVTFYL